MSYLKAYYQSGFRSEIVGIAALAMYKLIAMWLGYGYALYYWKQYLRSRSRLNVMRLQVVRKNKKVFVFANGTSLGDINLAKVQKLLDSGEYDLIAVNSFLSNSVGMVHPTYAVFSDNVHFKTGDRTSQYAKDIEACEQFGIRYLVPYQHFEASKDLQIGFNGLCRIHSDNTSNIFRSPGFYGLTALHALRLAKHLQYSEVYICGFDNSYFKDFSVKEDGSMVMKHRHYYGDEINEVEYPCLHTKTSEFFFDSYSHFKYIEKICCEDSRFKNIAKFTYLNNIERCFDLDVYNEGKVSP